MKTKSLTTDSDFLTNNHNFKWKRLSVFLGMAGSALASYLLAVPYRGVSFLRVVQISMTILGALAGRARVALVWIRPLVNSVTINNRIYAGLVMVSIVAPLSACVHMFLDKDAVVEGWYYYSNFYLFLVLGPYFFCLSIITAAFLWIPPIEKRIKFSQKDIKFQLTRILAIPFGLIAGKILWLLQVTSHEEFHQLPSFLSVIAGLVIGYLIIRILDYLVWRQEHAMNALIDSLEGLFSIPDMDHKQRTELAKPYWQELRKFHSKY